MDNNNPQIEDIPGSYGRSQELDTKNYDTMLVISGGKGISQRVSAIENSWSTVYHLMNDIGNQYSVLLTNSQRESFVAQQYIPVEYDIHRYKKDIETLLSDINSFDSKELIDAASLIQDETISQSLIQHIELLTSPHNDSHEEARTNLLKESGTLPPQYSSIKAKIQTWLTVQREKKDILDIREKFIKQHDILMGILMAPHNKDDQKLLTSDGSEPQKLLTGPNNGDGFGASSSHDTADTTTNSKQGDLVSKQGDESKISPISTENSEVDESNNKNENQGKNNEETKSKDDQNNEKIINNDDGNANNDQDDFEKDDRTPLTLTAALSDIDTEVIAQSLSEYHKNRIKTEYQLLSPLSYKRWQLYYTRKKRASDAVENDLNRLSHNGPFYHDDPLIDVMPHLAQAANSSATRHEIEYNSQELYTDEETGKTVEEINQIEANDQIKKYLYQFMVGDIDETTFMNLINQEIDNDNGIQNILQNANIQAIGTSLLDKAQALKDEYMLMNNIQAIISNANNNDQISWDSALQVKKLTDEYFYKWKKIPEFQKKLKDLPENITLEKLQRYFSHQKKMFEMSTKNMSLKLQILAGGKSAYQVGGNDRKVFWNNLAQAIENNPWKNRLITTGLIGTSVATLGVGGGVLASILVGTKLAYKKHVHYTQEQQHHEQRRSMEYDQVSNQIAQLQATRNQGSNWFQRYRAGRQLELYAQATQTDYKKTRELSSLLIQGLDGSIDQEIYNKAIIESLARWDYYNRIGHNFLASDQKSTIELEMKDFAETLAAVNNSGISLSGIRRSQPYHTLINQLQENYENAYNQFRGQRKNLATKYGLGGFMTGIATKFGLDWILQDTGLGQEITKLFGGDGEVVDLQVIPGDEIPIMDWKLDPVIEESFLQNGFDHADIHELEKIMIERGNPEYFWSAVLEVADNDQNFTNKLKNMVMSEFWNIYSDTGSFELLDAATQNGLTIDALSTAKFDKQVDYLVSKGIMTMQESDLLKESVELLITDNTIPSGKMQTVVPEFLFLHVGRDGGMVGEGSTLFDVTMECLQVGSTSHDTIIPIYEYFSAYGIPLGPTSNTFEYIPRTNAQTDDAQATNAQNNQPN